jgi:outer membrane lipoprotein
MSRRRTGLWIALAALLSLGGCATSRVPEAIREDAPTSPTVASVQQQPETFLGQSVRWGGTILAVHNGPDRTGIEILARPLGRDGEPDQAASGLGRFVVEMAGFKDPAEYPEGRLLTAVGTVTRVEQRDVGDYPYPYPVVTAMAWYLWPEPPPVYDLYPPFAYPWYRPWYGPWYDPWYGPWY